MVYSAEFEENGSRDMSILAVSSFHCMNAKSIIPILNRIQHLRELRMVREVGLEEALGLGNASDFRGDRVR